MNRPIARSFRVLAAVLVLGACAGGTPTQQVTTTQGSPTTASGGEATTTTAPQSMEPVDASFRLDWVVGGEHTPYVLGVEKGFFLDEGLDVELQQGTGSAVTVQLVGNGTVTFGNADTPPTVRGIEEGIPTRMVANFSPGSAFILQWVEGRVPDIAGPADLEGLTVGVHQGSTESSILPFFLESNGVDISQVNVVQGPPPTSMYTALVQGRIDVRMGLASSIPEIQQLDPSLEFRHLDLRDFGVELQAHGLIVNGGYAQANPDRVAAFVRAAQRSWQYVLEDEAHRDEAVEVTSGLFPEADADALRVQLDAQLDSLLEGSREGPLGFMPADRWESTRLILGEIFGEELELRLPVTGYYTNEYLSDEYIVPQS